MSIQYRPNSKLSLVSPFRYFMAGVSSPVRIQQLVLPYLLTYLDTFVDNFGILPFRHPIVSVSAYICSVFSFPQ